MAPKAIPKITALHSDQAPVLVANGGKEPVSLGSATRDGGGFLHVWDWSKSPRSRVLPTVEFWGTESVALTPDGKHLVFARGDILDLQTGKRTAINLGGADVKIGESTYRRIGGMQFSPDGGRLALHVTNMDERQPGHILREVVQVVAFPSGRRLCEFPAGESYALRIAFSHDSAEIVSSDPEKYIVRRDAATGTVLRQYVPALGSQVMGVAIAPDGKHVAAVQREPGDLFIWAAESGRLLYRIEGVALRKLGGHDPVYGVLRFSPNGKHLAAGYWGRIFILELATGRVAVSLREDMAADIRWSADGGSITAITPVTIGRDHPQGRADTYPSVHDWDWRHGELTKSHDAKEP